MCTKGEPNQNPQI